MEFSPDSEVCRSVAPHGTRVSLPHTHSNSAGKVLTLTFFSLQCNKYAINEDIAK